MCITLLPSDKRRRGAHAPPILEDEEENEHFNRRKKRGAHPPPPIEEGNAPAEKSGVGTSQLQHQYFAEQEREEGEEVEHEENEDEKDQASGAQESKDLDSEMAKLMGFSGFASSHGVGKSDEASKVSAARKRSTRQGRQYMNRKSGFNRPLPAERTGQVVNKS